MATTLSKKLQKRTATLHNHYQGFCRELVMSADCEVKLDEEEIFRQWVFVKIASMELSIESICEAVNKGVEMQYDAMKDIHKLKGN